MAPVRSPQDRTGGRLLLCLALFAAGCSGIAVRKAAKAPDLLDAWKASVLVGDELSPRSLQTLRLLDLEPLYRRRPAEAVAQLHALVLKDPQPDLLFTLAEICYLQGKRAERWACADAVGHYYLCAGYAYHYLFACAGEAPPSPPGADAPGSPAAPLTPADAFDPRFRLACDLYNAALSKCIAAAQRVGRLDPRQELRLPSGDGGVFTLSVTHTGFPWKPEEFGPLLSCDDYEVEGLANQHRAYGLGVPLIAVRAGDAPLPAHHYYPKEVSFPVTAFFRFDGGLAELGERRTGRLELYNPLTVQAIVVRGRSVPLETDLTTPLAYFLANTKLETAAYLGFLRGDSLQGRYGVHMLEPYQPGKIPVVLVHGLLSSPLTWMPVFNDLRADLDPDHKDDALGNMVLVGHSMGGLISKLVTVDSGDDFWREVSDRPFADLTLKPETRSELQRVFYFQRESCVSRVIFMGTPHRGSRLSPSPLGRLGDELVRLPKNLLDAAQDAATENPGQPVLRKFEHIPTSVDLLAPGAPSLELLASRPHPDGVHYHSIIGVVAPSHTMWERLLGVGDEKGDGVVPYESAHLDDAESELIVPADHFHVHQHPLAVLEIRRILLEHAEEPNGVRQVSGP